MTKKTKSIIAIIVATIAMTILMLAALLLFCLNYTVLFGLVMLLMFPLCGIISEANVELSKKF